MAIKGQFKQCFRLQTCVNLGRNQAIYAHIIYQRVRLIHNQYIDISSIYEAILYSNFKTKMADFLFIYLSLHMCGMKGSRGKEFARLRGHACPFVLFNYKIHHWVRY